MVSDNYGQFNKDLSNIFSGYISQNNDNYKKLNLAI